MTSFPVMLLSDDCRSSKSSGDAELLLFYYYWCLHYIKTFTLLERSIIDYRRPLIPLISLPVTSFLDYTPPPLSLDYSTVRTTCGWTVLLTILLYFAQEQKDMHEEKMYVLKYISKVFYKCFSISCSATVLSKIIDFN